MIRENVIAFRYSTTAIAAGTAYDVNATNQKLFITVKLHPPVQKAELVSNTTNNGRDYIHRKWIKKIYNPVISSDELDATAITFLENYWKANYKYISLKSGASWSSYIDVVTEQDEFPIQYLDDIVQFPEIEFELKTRGVV